MKYFGLAETKLFHRIFKNGGREGGSSEPFDPSLDLPLKRILYKTYMNTLKSCLMALQQLICFTVVMKL